MQPFASICNYAVGKFYWNINYPFILPSLLSFDQKFEPNPYWAKTLLYFLSEASQGNIKITYKRNNFYMALRFVFMVLEEHPYGREMLRVLLENNLVPSIIIQEVSAVSDLEREKFLKRIAGQPVPPRMTELITGKKIPFYCVGNHNDTTSLELLVANQPDILVLGGTRIIKQNILQIPTRGTVNAHPGLLPMLRGSASVGWALYKDLPQGATAHFIDPGIDTGDIIIKSELPVYHHDTYESLNYRIGRLSGELMAKSLQHIENGTVNRTHQDPGVGETFKVIPDDLLKEGIRRLESGHYSHYAD